MVRRKKGSYLLREFRSHIDPARLASTPVGPEDISVVTVPPHIIDRSFCTFSTFQAAHNNLLEMHLVRRPHTPQRAAARYRSRFDNAGDHVILVDAHDYRRAAYDPSI